MMTSSVVCADTDIIYVDWDATGKNDGTSWVDAHNDLQDALAVAISGDQIWVAMGTYKPTKTDDRLISFELKSGVEIYGGFPAEGGDWGSRDWGTNNTILSGDIGLSGDKSDNSYHVFHNLNVDSSAVLDGFTVTKGFACVEEGNWNDYGGGILNLYSNPKINNMILLENSASFGGGIYNYYSDPSINSMILTNNRADWFGGGIYNYYSDPLIISSTFNDNFANSLGGGMHNENSNPTITSSIFFSNDVLNWGGGMSNYSSSPQLSYVAFIENGSAVGGGMYNEGSNPKISESAFYSNFGEWGAGGIHNIESNPILTNVTFSANYNWTSGSAMKNIDSQPLLVNTTIFANQTKDVLGASIDNDNSNPIINNCIIWGNISDQIINDDTSVPIITYSIIQGGYEGEGNLEADPLLGELADNGGFTMTNALLEGSPAIDAGDPEACPDTDQRGVSRPQGAGCDIGAYEYEFPVELKDIFLPLILR